MREWVRLVQRLGKDHVKGVVWRYRTGLRSLEGVVGTLHGGEFCPLSKKHKTDLQSILWVFHTWIILWGCRHQLDPHSPRARQTGAFLLHLLKHTLLAEFQKTAWNSPSRL